ncbi:FadR/GntR family transcriptional regulator [Pelagibius sp. CAU 1746]|uniref:FadR/GntR family transcriptional regulator n=1 Tax=Pelagibius sp. CAU 1746 TaxID=3140370 RepID=UPI00325C248A
MPQPSPVSSSLHARIAERLGRDIVSGQIAEGALLPGVEELREQFGASRVIVREAIRTLGAKGLVYSRRRMGTRVAERAGWNLFDEEVLAWVMAEGGASAFLTAFVEFRLMVEPDAAALAAERASQEDLAPLRTSVDAMENASGDLARFHDADVHFHLALLKASTNPFVAGLGRASQTYLDISFRLQEANVDESTIQEEVEMHRRLLDLIETGEAEEARRECRRIIMSGKRALERSLQKVAVNPPSTVSTAPVT